MTEHEIAHRHDRVPPCNIEAEQAVLGGLMLSPEAWDKVADRLGERDFYRRDHQLLYRAIAELSDHGMPADAVTLGEWFEAKGLSELVGGTKYILSLANTTPSAANIVAYADIVREKSLLRQLIDVGTDIVGHGFDPEGQSAAEVLELAEQKVFQIAEAGARGRKGFVGMGAAVGVVARDRALDAACAVGGGDIHLGPGGSGEVVPARG